MSNLRKIDGYNFRNFNEAFLSLTQLRKQIYHIASTAHFTSIPFLVPTLGNYK